MHKTNIRKTTILLLIVMENALSKFTLFHSRNAGTNWCASILLGLPYHIDTEFLHSKELDTAEIEFDADTSNHHNLGQMHDVDNCCHSYQHCAQKLPVHNLNMDNPKRSQHCDCEFDLRKCLRDVDTAETNDFGRVHFYIADQCVMESHTVVECEQYDTIMSGTEGEERRCIEYTVDDNEVEKYQLLDLPFYYSEEERNQLSVDF